MTAKPRVGEVWEVDDIMLIYVDYVGITFASGFVLDDGARILDDLIPCNMDFRHFIRRIKEAE